MQTSHSRSAIAMVCASLAIATLSGLAHADTLNFKYVDLRHSILSPSDDAMIPSSLNDQGQAAGLTWRVGKVFNQTTRTWSDQKITTPVRWSATGYPTSLQTTSGSDALVAAINNAGTVTGNVASQAVRWETNNKFSALAPTGSDALGLNDSGLIVGSISAFNSAMGVTTRHATRWTGSTSNDLHALLPGMGTTQSSRAVAINSQGSVAIDTRFDMSSGFQSCFLLQGSSLTNLTAAGGNGCSVMGLADDNTVLTNQERTITCTPDSQLNGTCYPLNYSVALWKNGQLTTLQPYSARYRLFRNGLLLRVDDYTATPGQGISRIEADGTATPLTFNVTRLPTGYAVSDVVDVNRKGQYLVMLSMNTSAGTSTRWGVLTP